jgi:hypothetical protein
MLEPMPSLSGASDVVRRLPGILRALLGPDPIAALRHDLRETIELYEAAGRHDDLSIAASHLAGVANRQARQLAALSQGPLKIAEPNRRGLFAVTVVAVLLGGAELALTGPRANGWGWIPSIFIGVVGMVLILAVAFAVFSLLRGPRWVVGTDVPPEFLKGLAAVTATTDDHRSTQSQ